MRFWDSSAIVPLLVEESTSKRVQDLLRRDPGTAIWWCTPVECAGALARIHRQGRLRLSDLQRAQITLGTLMELSFEILPLESIRQQAQRLIGAHRLRAADAFQLAAAIIWHQQFSGTASFVSLDDRLRLAAALEGFRVMPYSEEVHEPAFDDFD